MAYDYIKENIVNIYKNRIIYKNDKIFKYDKYKSATSFSSLFGRSFNTFRSPASQTSTTSTQGRNYDASKMWSPISTAGKVYEWNRGVIGVNQLGIVAKENLDGTINHHSDATVRVVNSLGGNIEYENLPFQMGVNGSEQDILVFQSEGDNGLFYFPESLTNKQIIALGDILSPRTRFNFSYSYNEEIFEDLTVREVLTFAMSISPLSETLAGSRRR